MKMTPGLVGGHCIGVDPYYLTYKAEQLGYRPEVILSGRRINDNMRASVELQIFSSIESGDILSDLRDDDFLGVEVAYYY